jgi:tetratricopeptide (TPR) repeat protein
VYLEEGDLETSLQHFDWALRLKPDFPDALSNRGNALKLVGRLSEAVKSYRLALEIQPAHTDALNNLSNCYKVRGCRQSRLPLVSPVFLSLCVLLPMFAASQDAGDAVTAERMYRQALALRPDFAGRSVCGGFASRTVVSSQCCVPLTSAPHLLPLHLLPPGARSNLANLLKEQHRLDEALLEYKAAISTNPCFTDAYSNMGNCLKVRTVVTGEREREREGGLGIKGRGEGRVVQW